MSAGWRSNS